MTVGSKVRQTLVTLKGTESILRMYSVQEQNEEAKFIYKEALESTSQIVRDLEKRIKVIEFAEPQYKQK